MAAGGMCVPSPLAGAVALLQVGSAAISRDRVLLHCKDGGCGCDGARSVDGVRCAAEQAAV